MSMGPLYVPHEEVSVQVLCLIFYWNFCLPVIESYEFLIYFGDQTLVSGIIGKYVFPYSWFPFHFDIFFSCADAFYFDVVPFVILSFISLAQEDISVKILLSGMSEILLPMFSFNTFMVSWLMFKSFIHFEFIQVYGITWWLLFHWSMCLFWYQYQTILITVVL